MDEPRKLSQADKLVLLTTSQATEFFHSETKKAYARIIYKGARQSLPIRSRAFKTWLANIYWLGEEKAPSNEGLNSALNILEGKALHEGVGYTLYNRVAPAENGIWIDMSDENWRAIHVSCEGWSIIDNPPVLFKRYSHQLPLAEPKPGGNPWRLLDFFNIDPEDHGTRLTVLCTCISFLIPLIPHPIPVLHGTQGSGKTCLFKLLRRLLDPSVMDPLSLPRDERERVQQLEHHWLAFYDNVSWLQPWVSDTLCRAATGGGFSKRELYSDDDDVIYNFRRCVGLGGINIAAQRGDLLDRCLLVQLQNIPKEKRKTERELLSEFENCKAEILGGFLDALVKAIKAYPSVNPKGLQRMADFTRWGCAIAVALGKTEKEFLDAYEAKVKAQTEEAAHASPVATVLLDYLENNGNEWEGTPTELYRLVLNHARTLEISTRQKAFPKAPNRLVRNLNELTPSLRALGYEINTAKSGSTRRVCISTVPTVLNVPNDGKTMDITRDDTRDDRDDTVSEPSLTRHGKAPLSDDRDGRDGTFPTLGDVYQNLRSNLRGAFLEKEALDLIMKLRNCDLTQAEQIFHQFVVEGKVFRDPDGLWMWDK